MVLSNETVKEIVIQISLESTGCFLLTEGNKTQIQTDHVKHYALLCIQLITLKWDFMFISMLR